MHQITHDKPDALDYNADTKTLVWPHEELKMQDIKHTSINTSIITLDLWLNNSPNILNQLAANLPNLNTVILRGTLNSESFYGIRDVTSKLTCLQFSYAKGSRLLHCLRSIHAPHLKTLTIAGHPGRDMVDLDNVKAIFSHLDYVILRPNPGESQIQKFCFDVKRAAIHCAKIAHNSHSVKLDFGPTPTPLLTPHALSPHPPLSVQFRTLGLRFPDDGMDTNFPSKVVNHSTTIQATCAA
ncbi:hypothetical protein DSO57_1028795 [Entomophthora muscae]|uniref:Uncharacterized protein n=1 Tax=Entomophthora muscae TaxID=34485 RepID=A0ACC2UL98_9FUNG|nr:hypothetical protein DSO57_1028795 [Entomophthora muscae]